MTGMGLLGPLCFNTLHLVIVAMQIAACVLKTHQFCEHDGIGAESCAPARCCERVIFLSDRIQMCDSASFGRYLAKNCACQHTGAPQHDFTHL